MRRFAVFTVLGLVLFAFGAPAAWADHPHFVTASAVCADTACDTLTVSFKEAGLGSEIGQTVNIEASGTAECFNNGGKHPKAVNKTSPSNSVPEVVSKSGEVTGSEPLAADFSPSCSPPMTILWSNVKVCDTSQTPIDCKSIAGTFGTI
jgi:hypothetical protein